MRALIKGFATISLVIGIDDMFAKNFPASVINKAEELNDDPQRMKLPLDNNSTYQVISRFYKRIISGNGNEINPKTKLYDEEELKKLSPEDRKQRI